MSKHRITLASLTAMTLFAATGSAQAATTVERVTGADSGNVAANDYYAGDAILVFSELGKDNEIRVQRNNAGTLFFRDTSPSTPAAAAPR